MTFTNAPAQQYKVDGTDQGPGAYDPAVSAMEGGIDMAQPPPPQAHERLHRAPGKLTTVAYTLIAVG